MALILAEKREQMGENVLLVEDNPAEAQALIEALADPRAGPCTVEWVKLLAEAVHRLKSGGISIVLTRFQIDALKIDQSFVRAMTPDPEAVILGAVIAMAKSLKHRVVAEGIETPSQLASLQGLRCGEGQGYLFQRPGDADAFADLLEAGISKEIVFE